MISHLFLGVLFFIAIATAQYVFPPDFAFGTATAAYQVEGAYDRDGRGASIWDTFSHTPGKTYDGQTGDIADDHYDRFISDVALMKSLGLKHYRMSISWTRLFTNGTGLINPYGNAFYVALLDHLLDAGITPYVTLFHWDSPQVLEDRYGGWLSEEMPNKFFEYARACFMLFGTRVKHWFTFNEPLTFATVGYQYGVHAPGRCSDRSRCSAGNSSTEPYIVAHNILRAHAMASDLYRRQFQPQQNGTIAMVTNCDFIEPFSNSPADVAAANKGLEFMCAWFNDPLFFGDYPESMKQRLGARLPNFTSAEKQMLKNSSTHIALNHYSSRYGQNMPCPSGPQDDWTLEACINETIVNGTGAVIGPVAASNWLYVVPWGIRGILKWLNARYGNIPIFITENGVDEENTPVPVLNDTWRIDFYQGYISNVWYAMTEDHVPVLGYFAWSFMDNYEWADGYSKRFGMVFVDYNSTNLTRTPKESALWYSKVIENNTLPL